MRSSLSRPFVVALFLVVSMAGTLRCDVLVSGSILDPKTAGEAWNVIRLATNNVDLLLGENRLAEIPLQISLCSPSLRILSRMFTDVESPGQIEQQTKSALVSVSSIAAAAQQDNAVGVKAALASLRRILDAIGPHFDPKTINAEIFSCPAHSEFASDRQNATCAKCGLNLLPRRIPYSSIYTKPGEPTVDLTAGTSGPIEAGRRIEVKVRMAKADKSPVLHKDLIQTRTEPIHLLIEERGLGDFHHEHPVPTKTPGEYAFSFTPKKTVPYRIWADIVPAATGVQELPFVDLPSGSKATLVADTENRFTSTVGGFQFTLALRGGNHIPSRAQRARKMVVTITDSSGKPVTNLEPLMKAFAHMVGIYSDFDTVIRVSPNGGDILNPSLRGGPSLGFTLFPPKAGFLRLYCQVKIDGKILFAPFSLNIQP